MSDLEEGSSASGRLIESGAVAASGEGAHNQRWVVSRHPNGYHIDWWESGELVESSGPHTLEEAQEMVGADRVSPGSRSEAVRVADPLLWSAVATLGEGDYERGRRAVAQGAAHRA